MQKKKKNNLNRHRNRSRDLYQSQIGYHSNRYMTGVLQDVVDTHPGLTFLLEAPEFHSRYVNTVSSWCRWGYDCWCFVHSVRKQVHKVLILLCVFSSIFKNLLVWKNKAQSFHIRCPLPIFGGQHSWSFVNGSTVTFDLFLKWLTQGPDWFWLVA